MQQYLSGLEWQWSLVPQANQHRLVQFNQFNVASQDLPAPRVISRERLADWQAQTKLAYCGHWQGDPLWAVDYAGTAQGWRSLRDIMTQMSATEFAWVNAARQLLTWQQSHQFCGQCGHPTRLATNEYAIRCSQNCDQRYYPTPSPSIICAVVKDNQILLARNRRFPAGRFSLVAGFSELGESLEQAVAREVWEETGVQVGKPRYLSSQSWPVHNALMIGFSARYQSGEPRPDGDEIVEVDWFPLNRLPELPPVGSIARIIIDQWRSGKLPLPE